MQIHSQNRQIFSQNRQIHSQDSQNPLPGQSGRSTPRIVRSTPRTSRSTPKDEDPPRRSTPKTATSSPRTGRSTRLPRLVGLSPWSAHALAPAVWISGPLNSLDPLILNPLSWGELPRKGGNIQGEVFQGPGVPLQAPQRWPFGCTPCVRVSIWKHLGDGHLEAPNWVRQ